MFGIITINYNQYQMTKNLLDSLSKAKQSNKANIYIGNGSTKKGVLDFSPYNFRHLFTEKIENKGYAYGINQGVKHFLKLGIDKFCVINNDIFVDKNFLIEVEKGFEKADAFGGKIYYAPGYEYHKKRYRKEDLGKVFWYAGGWEDWKNVYTHHRGVDEVDHGQYDKFEKTELITGCLFCFNKKVISKVGLWDESYFLYREDSDYCERIKIKGFDLYYNPKVVIWHKVSQSTKGTGSSFQTKYMNKNRIKFGLKYAPLRTKLHLLKELITFR